MRHLVPAAGILAVLAAGSAAIFFGGTGDPERPAPSAATQLRGLAARLSTRYDRPRGREGADLAQAFTALADGHERRAASLGTRVGYRVARAGGVRLLEPGARARRRGWGVFAHRPDGADLAIEVPHPGSDLDTEDLGIRLFQASGARALLVAGARREAVDVAHDEESPFALVSAALARPGLVTVQLHGFDEREHDVGDAVISSGTDQPDPAAERVAEALGRAGYEVCLYRGGACEALAGRTNLQQRAAHEAGAQFVHVELARPLRDSAADRARVARVLGEALG